MPTEFSRRDSPVNHSEHSLPLIINWQIPLIKEFETRRGEIQRRIHVEEKRGVVLFALPYLL